MADVDAAPVVPAKATKVKTPKKKTASSKSKKPMNHPKYSEMIKAAVASLKERGGSSRQAILKYIIANYNVGKEAKTVNSHLKLALRAGVKNNNLKQSKGTGASGSFRLGEAKGDKKPKSKAKKPAAKKSKSPKKVTAKKPAGEKKAKAPAKKVKKPKAVKKSPAKAKAAKPKKAAKAKPAKKTKTPKKKAAAKNKKT